MRMLGVTLDPSFTFSAHAIATAKRAGSRLNILRALSNSSFGKDKDCLVATYKAFIRPIIDYAAPIVYPQYSAASLKRLQIIQNKSLRLATGCHMSAPAAHVHYETHMLTVDPCLRLFSAQFYAR